MDNLSYLNQLASQTAPARKNRLLSPGLIKFLIGAAIALVLIITLSIVIGSINSKTTTLYESYYLRLKNLSDDSGPINTYAASLKSSDLRAAAGTLKSSLTVTYRNLEAIIDELNIQPEELGASALSSEQEILTDYTSTLQNAKLNGLLDRTYASSTTLQISLIILMEGEILEKTSSDSLRAIVDQSMTDLEILHARFTALSNNSN